MESKERRNSILAKSNNSSFFKINENLKNLEDEEEEKQPIQVIEDMQEPIKMRDYILQQSMRSDDLNDQDLDDQDLDNPDILEIPQDVAPNKADNY